MKIILKTFLSLILLQSCQSQSDFDLVKIILNKDKISDVTPKNIRFTTYDIGIDTGDYKYSSTGSDKILIFNKINFSGENPKGNSENKAYLYFNIQDSIITRYVLKISVTKQSKELLETLKEKLGKPNYTGFHSEKDKIDDLPSNFIWEDIENNILYHLNYTKQHYGIETRLNVLPIMKTYPAMPGITYWEDFTYEREKRKDSNFTYQHFLKELSERYSDDFRNKLSK